MKLLPTSGFRCLAARGAGAICLAIAGVAALAAPQRLDDSASPRSVVEAPVVLSEQGRPLGDSLNPRFAFVKFGRVDYRLSTAAYVGRQARIYFVVPADIRGLRSPAGLRVEWRGQGRFASGAARPGERHLVWSGVVESPWLMEGLELNWQVDLNQMDWQRAGRVALESYFEIEVV